jgi:hypothetical protein
MRRPALHVCSSVATTTHSLSDMAYTHSKQGIPAPSMGPLFQGQTWTKAPPHLRHKTSNQVTSCHMPTICWLVTIPSDVDSWHVQSYL